MKKIKYRNNNYNNQVYSINYKFDSISPAGKCSGTALDLIKRYNELAKEAHGNGNYVEAEVFRQYAEHYRKIITEINERKNIRFNNRDTEPQPQETPVAAETVPTTDMGENENQLLETRPKRTMRAVVSDAAPAAEEPAAVKPQKAFTVIEVAGETPKPKRHYKPRVKKESAEAAVN